jgi:hypothetical protein
MTAEATWINLPFPASELDGSTIEIRISTVRPDRSGQENGGFGVIRLEPHPKSSGLTCLWITMRQPVLGPPELAMEQIEANYIQKHPDQRRAAYLCDVQYAE